MSKQRARRATRRTDDEAVVAFLDDLAAKFRKQARDAVLTKKRKPDPTWNGYLRVWTYGCTLVYKVLNDGHLAGRAKPSTEMLADALDLYVRRHLKKFLSNYDGQPARDPFDSFARLDAWQVEHLTSTLAEACLRDWAPKWIETRRAWGAKGKGISKNRPGFWDDPVNLEMLARLHGWTRREQAEFFEVSEETIKRGRGRLASSLDV
jgi:hypothetical protein